jgi:hypothetical protein
VRGSRFLIRDVLGGGPADQQFSFGRPGDLPVSGDWNGDGETTVGVFRGDTFHLRDTLAGGTADESFSYGRAGDVPLTGNWGG